jgi:hypothetical protein
MIAAAEMRPKIKMLLRLDNMFPSPSLKEIRLVQTEIAGLCFCDLLSSRGKKQNSPEKWNAVFL